MELTTKISNYYENLRRKNAETHEKRVEEIYKKIPEIREMDALIRDIALKASIEQIKNPDSDKSIEESEKIYKLKLKKMDFLEKRGYPRDYLDDIYTCKDCHDTGIIEDEVHLETTEKCHCLKKLIVSELYDMSSISYMLERENFGNFDLNVFSEKVYDKFNMSPKENMKNILAISKNYIKTFDEKNDLNLLLWGPTGQGKTFLLNCIAAELIKEDVIVIYQTAYEILKTMEDRKFKNKDDDKYNLYFEADLLIVDDLGIEFVNSFTTSEIFNIINTRLLRGKKTLISTNLSPKELSKTYTDRVFSRVFQKFVPIRFFGPDLRWQ
ncbi:MAG: ATP-binding protein [Peptoniphilus rhinitidis]|uniref:ATP-binding protein n=1 Tax=Peptoniphilus rhinitidis TaxID=1175452 RepID=UPI0028FF5673|nr:ATP-binding protein [Peptoniphilus rhinitidis]MDU2110402.1 ATP-binding protein [Peptoniphilus lacydonensis]MDU3750356.1 ATP-binding protein [Peptoniphilus rhinitidis]